MKSELVSIIVLTYNSSNTIVETLDSVAKQTYDNIEIVVSDDASKDDSIRIVQQWSRVKEIPVVIVTTENNTGIAGNCNRGVSNCQGDLIKIIAGDDLLEPGAIEEFYKSYISMTGKYIGMGKVRLFGEKSVSQEEYCHKGYGCVSLTQGEQLKKMLVSNFVVAPAIGLLRKKTILEYGGFNEKYPGFEDYPFYLKLLYNGYQFYLIDETLVDYRITNSSVSHSMPVIYMKSLCAHFFQEKVWMLIEKKMYWTLIKQYAKHVLMKIRISIA